MPAALRAGVNALWRLDASLGQVLAGGREPLISQIKLAWWRDSLEQIDRARAPAEPVLQAVAEHVVPRGISGSELSELEQAWNILLPQEPLSAAELQDYAAARGVLLFRVAARLLGGLLPQELEASARGWALVDLARHSNAVDAKAAMEAAEREFAERPRWPSALRPIGMLTALARRDVEGGFEVLEDPGAPSRMLTMLKHRISGR